MRSALALWVLFLGMSLADTPEPPLATPLLRMGESKSAPRTVRASDSFVLTEDVLLMFDTKDDCIFTSSRLGVVTITREPGPLRVKGRFAQSPERVETRTFAGKWVYTVEPMTKAGECELLAWVIGETDETKIQRFQVSIGGPRPPPPPPPPPVDEELRQLTAIMKSAYAIDADRFKASNLPKLAAVYRKAAAEVPGNVYTYGQLFEEVHKRRSTAISDGLATVRERLGAELFTKRWPTTPATAVDKQLAESTLLLAAKALEGVTP